MRGLGQLGFDWNQLIGAGANIGANIASLITGSPTTPTYGITGSTGAGGTSFTSSTWFWPVVIGGAVLLLMRREK